MLILASRKLRVLSKSYQPSYTLQCFRPRYCHLQIPRKLALTMRKDDSFSMWSTALLLAFMLCRTIHVSEAVDTVKNADFVAEGRGPGSNRIQQRSRVLLDNPPLSRQEKKENWRSCLLDLKAEYRRVVGKYVEGKNAVFVDMTEHWNLGDSFIQHGEMLLLKEMGSPVTEVCSWYGCNWTSLHRRIEEDPRPGVIVSHGGGNFGDIWNIEHHEHLKAVREFPNTPIVWFPQSVYYKDLKRATADAKFFSRNKNMSMLVRDLRSLSFLREFFTAFPSEIAPDGAFYIGPSDTPKCKPKYDVLVIARTDKEKVGRFGSPKEAVKVLEASNRTFAVVDWPCGIPKVMPKDRLQRPRAKFEIGRKCLCTGRVIVTDRLHAVILSTLMGLPHVFLDNSYGKVHAFRVAHLQPRPACSDANLNAHRSYSWRLAMKVANQILEEGW